jgi:hypothetical protein
MCRSPSSYREPRRTPDVDNETNHKKFTISYSNVSLEPPDPKLFERPARCNSPAMNPLGPKEAKPKPAKPAAKAPPKPASKPQQ